ncbi:hypothetical protein Dimus_022198 [Dionaea muscipula]
MEERQEKQVAVVEKEEHGKKIKGKGKMGDGKSRKDVSPLSFILSFLHRLDHLLPEFVLVTIQDMVSPHETLKASYEKTIKYSLEKAQVVEDKEKATWPRLSRGKYEDANGIQEELNVEIKGDKRVLGE